MKGIDIENIDDIDDIYYFISYLYNNIKDKDDEISIPYNMNIENTFEFLSKLIENIQTIIDSLDENIESNVSELLYYYFKNFRLFINNMILCLCSNTQSNNQLYCKDMDMSMSIDIYKYFIDGINI
jgi:hypothetical protein